jgi:hypothetical protein
VTQNIFFLFTLFGFKKPVFSFSADYEPVHIVLHVPSEREKQDYQQQSARVMHSIILL